MALRQFVGNWVTTTHLVLVVEEPVAELSMDSLQRNFISLMALESALNDQTTLTMI